MTGPASGQIRRIVRPFDTIHTLLRHALNLLALLSFLLCAAGAALWVRSNYASDWVRRRAFADVEREGGRPATRDADVHVRADSGRLLVTVSTQYRKRGDIEPAYVMATAGGDARRAWWSYARLDPTGRTFQQAPSEKPSLLNWLGFAYGWRIFTDGRVVAVVVPMWVPVILLSVYPAVRGWHAFRGRKRFREGLCPKCGYDLRESPEKCPECGTPVP